MSNFNFCHYTPRRSTGKCLATVLAIPLMFAAGFSSVWFHLFHIRVAPNLKLSSSETPLRTTPSIAVSLPPNGVFQQFGLRGNSLSSYNPGTSMFVRSLYGSSGVILNGAEGTWYIPPADALGAAMNVVEHGVLSLLRRQAARPTPSH